MSLVHREIRSPLVGRKPLKALNPRPSKSGGTARGASDRPGYLPPLLSGSGANRDATPARTHKVQADPRPIPVSRTAAEDRRSSREGPREARPAAAADIGVKTAVVSPPERPRSSHAPKPAVRRVVVGSTASEIRAGFYKAAQYFMVPDKSIGAERRVPLLNLQMNSLLARRVSRQVGARPSEVRVNVVVRTEGSPSPRAGSVRAPLSPRILSPRAAAASVRGAVNTAVHSIASRVLSPKHAVTSLRPKPPGTTSGRPAGSQIRKYGDSDPTS